MLTGDSKSASTDGAKFTLNIKEARFYFTQNLTEWEKRSVAWDLFQYGQETLEKVSQPSYSFTVDSADFLVMEEFEAFKNALSLGKRIYLRLDDGRVLTPLLLGFTHTFDEKNGLALEFSNKFTSSNKNDELADMVKQSISMGKKLDLSREVYSAFVDSHANTAIHDFMNGALDVAKNSILSTTGQAISWDENGLRLRKWNSDRTGYEDEQIWMKDNLIVFTEDAWQHAKMAIGHIKDDELGDLWGVIADSIVGKLLAGENLIIIGADPTGKKTLFRVDGSGMYAYNSRFWMENANGGAFAIDSSFGLGLGQGSPFIVGDDGTLVPKCIDPKTRELKLDKDGFPEGMNFWAGMDGQLYIRGNIYATDGVFNGTIYATKGEFAGTLKATTLEGTLTGGANGKIVGTEICVPTEKNPNFHVDSDGNVTIKSGSISWGAVTGTDEIDQRISNAQSTASSASSGLSSLKRNIGYTYIDGEYVIAPNIIGGSVTALDRMEATCNFYVGNNIYLGQGDQNGYKEVRFNGTSCISSSDKEHMKISCLYLSLAEIGEIDWGNNAPHLVLA